jgi:hypothetical protein
MPEISTENWRLNTVVQNSENNLYKYGSGKASRAIESFPATE